MVNVNKNKRILSLVMLGAVALIWGLGFVLADELLADGFAPVPGLQNAIRFGRRSWIHSDSMQRKHWAFGRARIFTQLHD
ncbi:MAG: hypothetical protein IKA29_05520, partial [Clostridia bacterium]|nr:hypothetical protein [Clostridia bacterium]